MTITTKYNLGDSLWFMQNNKPIQGTVKAIYTFNVSTNQDCIKYNLSDWDNPRTWLDHPDIDENRLYSTKEELLDSL